MHAAPSSGEPAGPTVRGEAVLLVAAAAVTFAALVASGGQSGSRVLWVGGSALLVLLAAGGAVLAGLLPRPLPDRAGWVFLLALAGLVAWTGASIFWSVAPDRSWYYLNRELVYLGFVLLGLLVGALVRRPARAVAGGLAALLGATLLWALAGKVFPALFPDGARIARLRAPVGYWNALALLGDMALPLYLWLAGRRRALGAVAVYGTVVAILLTYSRGGVLVGVLAVAIWLALGVARLESLAALAVASPAALGVSALAFALPGVVDDGQPYSTRVADGAWFGLALVAGGALVALVARRLRLEQLGPERRRALGRRLAAALALVLAAGLAGLALRGGGPGGWLREFRNPASIQVTQDPNRLASVSSNNRWTWWKEAWQVFAESPAIGKGAASFGIARTPIRTSSLDTSEPHNLALQFLAETGVVGFLLAAAATLAALAAARAALRRLRGPERAAAAALAVVLPAYLLHALDDFDWDFLAVTAPLFLVTGVLLSAGRPTAPPVRRTFALGAGAVLVGTVIASLVLPWLAARRVNAAYDAIGRGAYATAAAEAQSAHALDPFSLDPLWAWAGAEDARGDQAGALVLYRRAAERQPENGFAWYLLGQYEYEQGAWRAAYRDLNHAYTLDRYGPVGQHCGLLDKARFEAFGENPSGCPF